MINRVQTLLKQVFSRFRQQRTGTQLLAVLLVIPLCCCCALLGIFAVDSSLRGVGILPTLTATPTETATPTPTATPKATKTTVPTATLPPTNTATPKPTATNTPKPQSTDTPAPAPTKTPAPLPTNTAAPLPTNPPDPVATAVPQPTTAVPQPTVAPPPVPGSVAIVGVNKGDEYVDLKNQGGTDVDLSGWVLLSEKGAQSCGLGGVIGAGQTLRVWAMAEDAGNGGYNCNFGTNIWNNSEPDPAVLYDNNGVEVSRW